MRNRIAPYIVFMIAAGVVSGGTNTPDGFMADEGLKAVLWAGPDLIHSPVAMDVDAGGRIWVTEDLQRSSVKKGPHARIKILEDSDHDGRADSVKLFGPEFKSKPMGITVFDNKIVVSMAPEIHVYTDVNRDDVFDPEVDTKEVIAKGFHGQGHDHALHAVVPGPSGKWYVNHGNIGADVTMPDGRTFHASSYYSRNPESIGKVSSDGRLYVGGFGLRMDSDGHHAEVIFHNTRNTHGMLVTSIGDVLHADNDDPTHARAAWAMEFSNFGYASLEDGGRSWEDSAKSWEKKVVTQEIKDSAYERHSKQGLRRDEGHWRKHYPGVTPSGNLWGPGAPTGDYFVEGDELGRAFRGRYLMCETVHRAVFSFGVELKDAQIELVDLDKTFFAADRKSRDNMVARFLPSDIAAGTDGSLFVSDWNSQVNARGSGNAEGAIYRIAPRSEARISLPVIDFTTLSGLIDALKSPVPGVRWVAQDRLKKMEGATEALIQFASRHADNEYYQARAVFVLAQLEQAKAQTHVMNVLGDDDPRLRIAAFRALRFAGKSDLMPIVEKLSKDPSASVRREMLLSLRNVSLDEAAKPLAHLIAAYDGKNRWYLEAIGAACDGRSKQVYNELIRPQQSKPASWNLSQKRLAWRLRSPEALADLAEAIRVQAPGVEEFRELMYTYALSYTAEEREQNTGFMSGFLDHPAFAGDEYQVIMDEFLEKDIKDPPPAALTQNYVFPTSYGVETTLDSVDDIAKLKPDVKNGKAKIATCYMCHRLGDTGVSFGPELTSWGEAQDAKTIIQALVNPSAELAHGYDKPVVITQGKYRLEGISRGKSYHAGAIRVKTIGGETIKLPFRRPRANIKELSNHSWMPSASAMGFSSQDVRDIAAYLMSGEAGRVADDK